MFGNSIPLDAMRQTTKGHPDVKLIFNENSTNQQQGEFSKLIYDFVFFFFLERISFEFVFWAVCIVQVRTGWYGTQHVFSVNKWGAEGNPYVAIYCCIAWLRKFKRRKREGEQVPMPLLIIMNIKCFKYSIFFQSLQANSLWICALFENWYQGIFSINNSKCL